MNYLNEFDPVAAAWLRELRDAKLIPPCDIDTRSIEDVEPRELAGYTQCHFFAGIGGWPLALQLAGWPVHRSIWTGSCPCQPFSAAGKGAGFADERHLWPAFHWLIEQCRPRLVLGEQVASAAVGPWIDLVLTDLEALDYACGAYAGPAAGVGSPQLRDRAYWVGIADGAGLQERKRKRNLSGGARGAVAREAVERTGLHAVRLADAAGVRSPSGARDARLFDGAQQLERSGSVVGVGHADGERAGRIGRSVHSAVDSQDGQHGTDDASAPGANAVGLADIDGRDASAEREQCGGQQRQFAEDRGPYGLVNSERRAFQLERPGPTNGDWADADWLRSRDGKWRPVEPSTFPLGHGLPARVGRLRGYGNAIVPQQAAEFIKVLMAYSNETL